jgi:excisionase family DNA binding protein
MATKEPIRVYTLDEVAEVLKITRRTLYTYVKEGKLKAVKIGREWRVSEAALQDFINKGTEA